jgi:hypothetical protein
MEKKTRLQASSKRRHQSALITRHPQLTLRILHEIPNELWASKNSIVRNER